MKLFLFIALLLFVAPFQQVLSQEIKTVRDIGVWAQVGVDYEPNKDWNFSLSQGVRTYDNALSVAKTITTLEFNYKINRNFKLETGVRYSYDRKKDLNFTHDIRHNFDLKFKGKLTDKFVLKYRLRFQNNYINLFTYVPEVKQKAHGRSRVSLEYGANKHTVYVSTEIFREYVFYKKPAYNNIRFMLGDQFKTQIGNIDVALAYERELNDKTPFNFFFLNLKYNLKLKRA